MALTLDPDKPGKLRSSADNEKEYFFYLVMPRNEYSEAEIAKNPAVIRAGDILLKGGPIRPEGPDAEVVFDMKKDGRKEQLQKELGKRRKKGINVQSLKAVVVATASEECKGGPERLAKVVEIKLTGPKDSLTLHGIKTKVRPDEWIWYHHALFFVQLVVTGDVKQVEFVSANGKYLVPVVGIWESPKVGQLDVKKMLHGNVGDDPPANKRALARFPKKFHRNALKTWFWKMKGKLSVEKGKVYTFALYPRFTTSVKFEVRGTGQFKNLQGAAQLTFEGKHPSPGD